MPSHTDLPSEEEQRSYFRQQWLGSIQAFADTETQEQRWPDVQERNPYYSYIECMCAYFDDLWMGKENAYQRRLEMGHLTRDEVNAVTDFHAAASAHSAPDNDDYNVAAILADPAWRSIVYLAQRAQERLLVLLTDPIEREIIARPMQWREKDGIFTQIMAGTT